jgi:hypothetical protein
MTRMLLTSAVVLVSFESFSKIKFFIVLHHATSVLQTCDTHCFMHSMEKSKLYWIHKHVMHMRRTREHCKMQHTCMHMYSLVTLYGQKSIQMATHAGQNPKHDERTVAHSLAPYVVAELWIWPSNHWCSL